MTDSAGLEQIVYAIVSNSIHYSYRDCDVELKIQERPMNFLEIAFQSKGIPVRVEDIPSVFEKGWRSPLACSVYAEGLGNGLWMAKHLVQAMNGKITIASTNEEEVTTTLVFLPLAL